MDFGQSNNTFYGSLAFLNITFTLLPGGKSTGPGEFTFFYIAPLKSLNLVLIPGAKLDGHRSTWTEFTAETKVSSPSKTSTTGSATPMSSTTIFFKRATLVTSMDQETVTTETLNTSMSK